MNIESASVFFRGHSAVAAYLIALSDNFCSLLPKSIINWIRVFTETFANVIVNVLAAIPKIKTFQRTTKAMRMFARFATNSTWATWFPKSGVSALSRTKTVGVSFDGLAANFARRKWFYLAQISALPRTKAVVVVAASFTTYLTKWKRFTVKCPKAFRGAKLSLLWLSKLFSTPGAVSG